MCGTDAKTLGIFFSLWGAESHAKVGHRVSRKRRASVFHIISVPLDSLWCALNEMQALVCSDLPVKGRYPQGYFVMHFQSSFNNLHNFQQ